MTVAQIYDIINPITKEILGETAVVNEDLSNIVDIGKELFDATEVDNYVKSLVNHIGRVIFVNRPYSGGAPSVLMDGWEYGSVLEKISAELPEATENESWELTDGASYDPNIFYKPKVSAKFFNKKVTFEIPMSFTEKQVKESFSNASQLNGFLSMLYNAVDKSMTIKIDSLVMRTINNMIAETLHDFSNIGDYTGTGIRAVNLLKLYNDDKGTTLTAEKSIKDPDFIRFASYIMGLYMERLSKISSLFNIGGKDRFTPRDLLHVILLSDFAKASDSYSMSSTFHNEFVALPKGEIVPYWQGSGTDYSFNSVSSINVKTASGDTVNASGIIGVMFDRDALGVTNLDRRVTTNYNPKAEFFSNWYKFDAGYFNDMNENFVLFYVA
jgi:hypothetical protein